MTRDAEVVIAGAGIAGLATAFHLSVGLGVTDVVVCDPRPPLSLTSDKSTECYRNWWPNRAMVSLMNRSIDLLERWAVDSDNAFNLSRRGYLYVTGDPGRLADMASQAERIASLGAGGLRLHGTGQRSRYQPVDPADWTTAPGGADVFTDGARLRESFPYLTEQAVGGVHARRAGWVSAQQLGMWLLNHARDAGLTLLADEVTRVEAGLDGVRAVELSSGELIRTARFVNAAGPLVRSVAALVGEDLPVHSELHRKISFQDQRHAVARDAPMLIWNDPQRLSWEDEALGLLAADPDLAHLAGELGPGAHCRPDGPADAATVLGLWEYVTDVSEPRFPIPEAPIYPEIVLNGLATMIPAVADYLAALPATYVDGGYYTKTTDNTPLIGPMSVPGSFVVGGLSGYGVMAAAAAGELAALHVTGSELPPYAAAHLPERYSDPGYVGSIDSSIDTGQI